MHNYVPIKVFDGFSILVDTATDEYAGQRGVNVRRLATYDTQARYGNRKDEKFYLDLVSTNKARWRMLGRALKLNHATHWIPMGMTKHKFLQEFDSPNGFKTGYDQYGCRTIFLGIDWSTVKRKIYHENIVSEKTVRTLKRPIVVHVRWIGFDK